jgi:hypothetical protein
VIARAVFAPGRVNYHRIMGAILLYLTIACASWLELEGRRGAE